MELVLQLFKNLVIGGAVGAFVAFIIIGKQKLKEKKEKNSKLQD